MANGLPESQVEIVIEADTSSLPPASAAIEQLADTATRSMEHAGSAAHSASQAFEGIGPSVGHAHQSTAGFFSSLVGARRTVELLVESLARLSTLDFSKLLAQGQGFVGSLTGAEHKAAQQVQAAKIEVTNNVTVGVGRDDLKAQFERLQENVLDQVLTNSNDLAAQQRIFLENSRQRR